jgi:hypothetical protein
MTADIIREVITWIAADGLRLEMGIPTTVEKSGINFGLSSGRLRTPSLTNTARSSCNRLNSLTGKHRGGFKHRQ